MQPRRHEPASRVRSFALSMLTLAGVLLPAANVHADVTSPTILVASNRTDVTPTVGPSGMHYRVWNSTTKAWGAATTIGGFSESGAWVVARNCPTRNETAVIAISRTKALRLATFDGTNWSTVETLCSNVGDLWNHRGADMVYTNTGTMLVAWWDYAAARIGFRNGSTTGTFSLPTADHVRYLELVARPGSRQALMLVMDSQRRLYASIFNGTTFTPATMLDDFLDDLGREGFAGAYFGIPSRPVVVYAPDTELLPRYRAYTNGAWTAEQSFNPGHNDRPRIFRLITDPVSRNLLLAFSTSPYEPTTSAISAKGLAVARFTSAGWTGGQHLTFNVQYTDRRCFDIAFEPGGTKALLCYAASDTGDTRYRTFDGSTWSAEASGSNVASTICVWSLFTGTDSGEVFAMPYNTSNFLNAARFSRNNSGVGTLSSHTQLAKTLDGSQQARAFMIAGPVSAIPSEDEEEAPPRIVRWKETASE
ncbi:MAG: hypothetical protein ACKVZJ_15815 [Phycisphaerales bacterium]